MTRYAAAAFAALLILLLSLSFNGGSGGNMTRLPAAVLAAPKPPAAVKAGTGIRKKAAAKRVAAPVVPFSTRGAKLRDKGEALGGGTPDRVDIDTTTAPARQ